MSLKVLIPFCNLSHPSKLIKGRVCTAHCAVILHWVSLCTEYYVQCQGELKIILDQCPDIEELYIFLYTARSAANIGICATLDQEKYSFPFAFGYRKITIIFSTSGALRNILQNNSS